MSVEIIGLWELGWNTPIKEIDLWQFVAMEFAIDTFYMCPVSGIQTGSIPIQEVAESDLNSFFSAKRAAGIQIVFIDEIGTTPLRNFAHPQNSLYVFGKVSASLYAAYNTPADLSIVIPTITNKGTMWPHQCAAIILYDRMLKSQTL